MRPTCALELGPTRPCHNHPPGSLCLHVFFNGRRPPERGDPKYGTTPRPTDAHPRTADAHPRPVDAHSRPVSVLTTRRAWPQYSTHAVQSGAASAHFALYPTLTQTSVKLYRLPSNVHRSPAGRRSICQNTWRPGGHASLKKARVVLGGEGCIFGVILSDALPDIVGHGLGVPGGGGLVLGELAVIASKLLLGEPAHGRKRRNQIDRRLLGRFTAANHNTHWQGAPMAGPKTARFVPAKIDAEVFEPKNVVAVSKILRLRHPVAVLVHRRSCRRRQAVQYADVGLSCVGRQCNPARLRECPLNRVAGHAECQRSFVR